MKRLAVLWIVTVAAFGCTEAAVPNESPAAPSSVLEGAWEVTRASDPEIDSDQPGLYIFHGEHYSVLHVWNEGPRPQYEDDETRETVDFDKLTAIVGPVEGNSGRYVITGSTLTMTPTVAISPNFMSGLSRTYTFQVSGDELTLEGGSIEGLPGAADVQRTLTLRRVD